MPRHQAPELPNIALTGKAGSGKTLLAEYLAVKYGYQVCSSGELVREISSLLFADTDRAHLNAVSQAIRNIGKTIWIEATLRQAAGIQKPIILDSIRYRDDYQHIKNLGWTVVRITAETSTRRERLRHRGQISNEDVDGQHASEIELDAVEADLLIRNEASKCSFLAAADEALSQLFHSTQLG